MFPGRPMAKSNKMAGEYAKACVEAANECGTKCVDLYTTMMKNEVWRLKKYVLDLLWLLLGIVLLIIIIIINIIIIIIVIIIIIIDYHY